MAVRPEVLVEGQAGVGRQGDGDRVDLFVRAVEEPGLDEGAGDRGAVPADEFGGRVQHDVSTPLDRAAEVGRGEGVVDHERDVVGAGDLGDGGDVEDVRARVANRLAVEDAGPGGDGVGEV